jgi:hypothetical protein
MSDHEVVDTYDFGDIARVHVYAPFLGLTVRITVRRGELLIQESLGVLSSVHSDTRLLLDRRSPERITFFQFADGSALEVVSTAVPLHIEIKIITTIRDHLDPTTPAPERMLTP